MHMDLERLQGDLRRLGLWALRLMFTTESPPECARVREVKRKLAGVK